MKKGPLVLSVGVAVIVVALIIDRRAVLPETTIRDMAAETREVALPFYPPTGHVSLDGYFTANIGKEVFVIGEAFDSKVGPAIALNTMPRAEAQTLYIKDIEDWWPQGVARTNVSITGILQREKYIPDPQVIDGLITAGADGLQWTLSQSTWIPLRGVYSVNQLSLMPNSTEGLQNAVITKLKVEGENPDDFYVDNIEVKAKEWLVSVIHKDTLRPNQKHTVGNPSGKDRVMHYDHVTHQITQSLFTQ